MEIFIYRYLKEKRNTLGLYSFLHFFFFSLSEVD